MNFQNFSIKIYHFISNEKIHNLHSSNLIGSRSVVYSLRPKPTRNSGQVQGQMSRSTFQEILRTCEFPGKLTLTFYLELDRYFGGGFGRKLYTTNKWYGRR